MSKNNLTKLKECLEKYGSLNPNYDNISKIYSMCTENIYGFLSNYDLKDKKVLTVAGSGDQRLNAYFMGAKSVTCFDVNSLSESQINLKDAAIKTINFEKFIKFFGIYSRKYGNDYKMLDSKIFYELSNKLDIETYLLFDYIINNNSNYIDINKHIYYPSKKDLDILEKMNNYLNPDDYLKLRYILKDKKVDFINTHLTKLKECIGKEKFDVILLSNISDYINRFLLKNDLLEFRKIIENLKSNLNSDGIIQVGYIYSDYKGHGSCSDFRNDEIREKYFSKNEFSSIYVSSFDNINNKDKVIVYGM